MAKRCLLGFLVLVFLAAGCRGGGESPAVTAVPSSVPQPTVDPALLRRPVVAGTFYPDDSQELAAVLQGYLEGLGPSEGRPRALIVPHAGYVYSGPVAAYAYAQLLGQHYEAVVLIGPNHRLQGFTGIAIYPGGAWETPLGQVPVATELAQALLQANPDFLDDPALHSQEHSLEVQIPFLQQVLPDTPIVPVMMGWPSRENTQALAAALVEVLQGRDVLLIASTDLSHYPTYESAVEVDGAILTAVETMDLEVFRRTISEQMSRGIPNLLTTCCGEGAIAVVLEAAPGLGIDRAEVLHYANSGDVPVGDRAQVVGYGAVKFWASGE